MSPAAANEGTSRPLCSQEVHTCSKKQCASNETCDQRSNSVPLEEDNAFDVYDLITLFTDRSRTFVSFTEKGHLWTRLVCVHSLLLWRRHRRSSKCLSPTGTSSISQVGYVTHQATMMTIGLMVAGWYVGRNFFINPKVSNIPFFISSKCPAILCQAVY